MKNSVQKRVTQDLIGNWFKNPSAPYYAIILSCLIVYGQTLLFGLVYFDDHGFVLLSDKLLKLSSIPAFFKHSVFWVMGDANVNLDYYYRPLQNVVYVICSMISPKSPWGFHFVGLVLHILAAVSLFNFFKELKYQTESSLALTLIFCVHPALSQAVSWIAGIGDQLATIFSLWCFIYFFRLKSDDDKNKTKWIFLHTICFGLALFSKETSLMIVLLCILHYFVTPNYKTNKSGLYKLLTAWLFVIPFYFLLRNGALHSTMSPGWDSIVTSFKTNGLALFKYIEKVFFPYNLSPVSNLKDVYYVPGLVLSGAILAGFVFRKRLSGIALFGVLWFFLFLIPTFIIVNSRDAFYLYEHRLYLPFAGILLVVAELVHLSDLRLNSKFYRYGFVLILLVLSTITYSYNKTFKNSENFFTRAIHVSPSSDLAVRSYAKVLAESGRYDEAVKMFKKIYESDSGDVNVAGRIGDIYKKNLSNPSEANAWFRKAFNTDSHSEPAANNIADTYLDLKDTSNAETWYKRVIELNPENVNAYLNLGIIYVSKNRRKEAEPFLAKALNLDSSNTIAYKWLAISFYSDGKMEEAIKYLEKGFKYNPKDMEIQKNLMICYYRVKNKEKTREFAKLYSANNNPVPAEIANYLQ